MWMWIWIGGVSIALAIAPSDSFSYSIAGFYFSHTSLESSRLRASHKTTDLKPPK